MIPALAVFAFVACAFAEPTTALDGRIIGGNQVSIENVPYQVSLRKLGSHICGGSIVSPRYVLTAAHCVGSWTLLYRIRAGSSTNKYGGSLHRIKKIIKHKGYIKNKNGVPVNDIALIEVRPLFKLDKTRAVIPLNVGETFPNNNATISGWGITETENRPVYLQAVNVPIVSKKECKEAYHQNELEVPEGQICAAYPEGGKDACQGDSGGPLAVNGHLAGIVSWGVGCGQKGKPGVYTEVAHHLLWIRKYVRQ